jgi:hypothetical protein
VSLQRELAALDEARVRDVIAILAIGRARLRRWEGEAMKEKTIEQLAVHAHRQGRQLRRGW